MRITFVLLITQLCLVVAENTDYSKLHQTLKDQQRRMDLLENRLARSEREQGIKAITC